MEDWDCVGPKRMLSVLNNTDTNNILDNKTFIYARRNDFCKEVCSIS